MADIFADDFSLEGDIATPVSPETTEANPFSFSKFLDGINSTENTSLKSASECLFGTENG